MAWKQKVIFLIIVAILSGVGIAPVYAAPLSYNADTSILLASPVITLTIVSGSVADSLVVNGGNIVVTLSSSTSGNFTITSASRGLTTSITGSGGVASQTCTGVNITTLQLSQPTSSSTYTITPTSGLCDFPSPVGASYFSTGGGTLSTSLRVVATTTVSTIIPAKPITTTTGPIIPALNSSKLSTPPISFMRNFSIGSRASDVIKLQKFLIGYKAGAFATQLSVVGATGYFGVTTKKALIEFQKKVGIRPPNGLFGPLTRSYINKFLTH